MAHAALLNLRPLYFADRRLVAEEPPAERSADIGKWLNGPSRRQDLNVAARNQVLFDAVRILEGAWSEEGANQWDFVKVSELAPALKKLSSQGSGTSEELLTHLAQWIERATRETYGSYAQFQQAELARRQQQGERFSGEQAIEDYSLWFSTNRPYLLLNLDFPESWSDARVGEEIKARVKFFTQPLPEGSGLEDHFGEIARQQIELQCLREMEKRKQK